MVPWLLDATSGTQVFDLRNQALPLIASFMGPKGQFSHLLDMRREGARPLRARPDHPWGIRPLWYAGEPG